MSFSLNPSPVTVEISNMPYADGVAPDSPRIDLHNRIRVLSVDKSIELLHKQVDGVALSSDCAEADLWLHRLLTIYYPTCKVFKSKVAYIMSRVTKL